MAPDPRTESRIALTLEHIPVHTNSTGMTKKAEMGLGDFEEHPKRRVRVVRVLLPTTTQVISGLLLRLGRE